jgi:hypothetical protein
MELTNDTSEKQPASSSGTRKMASRKKPIVATARSACLSWGNLIRGAATAAAPKHAIALTRKASQKGCGYPAD